jgi:hypothetical protein
MEIKCPPPPTKKSSTTFTRESFNQFVSKIGFRINGVRSIQDLIDKDSLNTKIKVKTDGIEFKNANSSFCVFFKFGKNTITLYEEENFVSISNEDESIFINLYGF